DHHPWLPFRCQLDFEVAELVHETALTHEQMMCLIQLVQHGRTEDFTLKITPMFGIHGKQHPIA
ncbi:hypothetical protein BDR04DRAFT_1038337, partial [Suillus decipiens]